MGASGSPSVKTYVIGVLSAADIMNGADTNLQTIATSGGQGQAFIINSTNQNVEMQFVQAMNQIRSAKLACEYAVPPPPDGGMQDYTKVNVEFTPPGGNERRDGRLRRLDGELRSDPRRLVLRPRPPSMGGNADEDHHVPQGDVQPRS